MLGALRAVRHRTANQLQVAFGWAQLGEAEGAREALERLVAEEALLSALSRSGDEAEQMDFWQVFAAAERAGQALSFRGRAADVAPGALRELLPRLRAGLARGAARVRVEVRADGTAAVAEEEA